MTGVCDHCGRAALGVEAYRVAQVTIRLCAGCLADCRIAGMEVHWIPRRLYATSELKAFRSALEAQARIMEMQRGWGHRPGTGRSSGRARPMPDPRRTLLVG